MMVMNYEKELVDQLITSGELVSRKNILAFRLIDRADFVPPELAGQAYSNRPLAIGFGQTVSQPQTVAFMLELLKARPGQKVLDVGCGSGWQAALLAVVVGRDDDGQEMPPEQAGKVISLELIPELAKQARKNLAKYNFLKQNIVSVHNLNAVSGYSPEAPYDRIISAATSESVPPAWIEQLKVGGRLVMPSGSNLVLGEKKTSGELKFLNYPGFAFVPFVSEDEDRQSL